jgi:putative PIN family toxin of toxin-antitoxin system
MKPKQVVIDTNVIIAALRSRRGASFRLLTILEKNKFTVCVSVPLVMEYEDVAKRFIGEIALNEEDIEAVIDYICSVARQREIYFLWRPFLKDPKDDMLLELAVAAECQFIVTFNKRDFTGCEQFGIKAISPRDFLEEIGEVP